jgi:hypothetical protein
VQGVTCYVSRARIGGIKGTLGLAEDRAEASIACRQVGPISFPEPLKKQEEVFSERMSILFKRLRIVRMVDAPRNTLVYLTYSEKLIDGSPQNSVTAVPVTAGPAHSGAQAAAIHQPRSGHRCGRFYLSIKQPLALIYKRQQLSFLQISQACAAICRRACSNTSTGCPPEIRWRSLMMMAGTEWMPFCDRTARARAPGRRSGWRPAGPALPGHPAPRWPPPAPALRGCSGSSRR